MERRENISEFDLQIVEEKNNVFYISIKFPTICHIFKIQNAKTERIEKLSTYTWLLIPIRWGDLSFWHEIQNNLWEASTEHWILNFSGAFLTSIKMEKT